MRSIEQLHGLVLVVQEGQCVAMARVLASQAKLGLKQTSKPAASWYKEGMRCVLLCVLHSVHDNTHPLIARANACVAMSPITLR